MAVYVQVKADNVRDGWRFLGPEPERWWVSDRLLGFMNRQAAVVRGDGANWRAVLLGIPSKRRDSWGVPHLINLAWEGPCASAPHVVEGDGWLLMRILGSWLPNSSSEETGTSRALDLWLDSQAIEHLSATSMQSPSGLAVAGASAEQLVRQAAVSLPAVGETLPGEPGSWIGDAGTAVARDDFITHVAGLLSGNPGAAAYLPQVNLADVEDIHRWDPAGANLALLVTDSLEMWSQPRAAPPDILHVLEWVGTVIASGVIGNLATDALKTLRKVRRRKRKQLVTPMQAVHTIALLAVKARCIELDIPVTEDTLSVTDVLHDDRSGWLVTVSDPSRRITADVRIQSDMKADGTRVTIRQVLDREDPDSHD